LKKQLPCRGGGINPLLMQVKVGVFDVKVVEEGYQVLQAPTKSIYAPRCDHVELPPHNPFAQRIESRAALPTLCAADSLVNQSFDNLPALFLCYRLKFA